MTIERSDRLARRAAVHAALADVTRLRIVDVLATSDASSSELALALRLPTNLLAHHVKSLEAAGLVCRRRSEGDGRRTYLQLVRGVDGGDVTDAPVLARPARLVFVCTANSARSQLAAALWARSSPIPAASAGTHPAEHVHPGAVVAAGRHHLALADDARPRLLQEVDRVDDVLVTVCDLAHEELGSRAPMHWSVPDPVRTGTPAAFDVAHDELAARVEALASRFRTAS